MISILSFIFIFIFCVLNRVQGYYHDKNMYPDNVPDLSTLVFGIMISSISSYLFVTDPAFMKYTVYDDIPPMLLIIANIYQAHALTNLYLSFKLRSTELIVYNFYYYLVVEYLYTYEHFTLIAVIGLSEIVNLLVCMVYEESSDVLKRSVFMLTIVYDCLLLPGLWIMYSYSNQYQCIIIGIAFNVVNWTRLIGLHSFLFESDL